MIIEFLKVDVLWFFVCEICKLRFYNIKKKIMKYTIEKHPWNIFPKSSPIKKLIIGSFPPNKMVLPVGCKMKYLDEIVKVNKRETKRFDFFYGSQQNEFWVLFFKTQNINLEPSNLDGLKQWLKINEWGVTDIVFKTTRKKDSPSDNDLIPKEWNIDVIEKVLKMNTVKNIYFTSKWVQKNFIKRIKPSLHQNILKHLLISPSPSGLRVIPKDILHNFPKNKNESNKDFRFRYFEHVLLNR